ncbi:MAG: hypothetical protein ACR2HG_12830 [Pyrinomonadaceae bacterium]
MQLIGLGSAVGYIASLAFFLLAFSNPEWRQTGFILGFVFFIFASLILAMMIKKRWRTEKT